MRRRDHNRPDRAEALERGDRERRSLVGIRSVSDLIDEAERPRAGCPAHHVEIPKVRGERAERRRYGLFIADVRVNRAEDRQPRPFSAGDGEPALKHENGETERLERHRLAPGVGAGDDENMRPRIEREVQRNDGSALRLRSNRELEKRMPGIDQMDAFVQGYRGIRAAEFRRETRFRLERIEQLPAPYVIEERAGCSRNHRRELTEDSRLFGALVVDERLERVVPLDEREGFEIQGLPRVRGRVDESFFLAALVARNEEYVTRSRVRRVVRRPVRLRQLIRVAAQFVPSTENVPANRVEPGARRVLDSRVAVDRTVDRPDHLMVERHVRHDRTEQRVRRFFAHRPLEIDDRFLDRREGKEPLRRNKLVPVESVLDPLAAFRLGDGKAAGGLVILTDFPDLAEPRADRVTIGSRASEANLVLGPGVHAFRRDELENRSKLQDLTRVRKRVSTRIRSESIAAHPVAPGRKSKGRCFRSRTERTRSRRSPSP